MLLDIYEDIFITRSYVAQSLFAGTKLLVPTLFYLTSRQNVCIIKLFVEAFKAPLFFIYTLRNMISAITTVVSMYFFNNLQPCL